MKRLNDDVNKVWLSGKVIDDVENKICKNGDVIYKTKIVSEKNGQPMTFTVYCFENMPCLLSGVVKGDKISVVGELIVREYKKINLNKGYATEIKANEVTINNA